mmetsp:Transcript_12997/g.24119  ORF Transcript_12997/g.24119 Transcript_12997/m.24119 type:complete len:356 (+) Transcript_12997:1678-2745(+)
MVPLADSLNHANVNVVYEVRSESFLTEACAQMIDYSDFSGISSQLTTSMPNKSCKNRLQKFLKEKKPLPELVNIWDVDEYLTEYQSSSDEACSDTDEESGESYEEGSGDSSEEQSDEEIKEEAGSFFVMRTRLKSSFEEGAQVFNCYGRLSNADLLLNYGFAMEENEYESFDLRIWRDGRNTPHTLQFAQEAHIAKKLARQKKDSEYAKIRLKLNKLSTKLLSFFRKTQTDLNSKDPGSVKAEIDLVRKVIDFLEVVNYQRRYCAKDDLKLLAMALPQRLKFAVMYRLKQTQILESQIMMLRRLILVLRRVNSGQSLREAHLPIVSEQTLEDYYPMRSYLQKLELMRRKTVLFSS